MKIIEFKVKNDSKFIHLLQKIMKYMKYRKKKKIIYIIININFSK